jgi:glycosyltransferase involved in cell wall biosynthesis
LKIGDMQVDQERIEKKKLKILYIVHSVSWTGGGAFFHALHFAKGMVRLGHSVTVLAISKDRRFSFSEKKIDDVTLVESPDMFPGQARSGWDIWNTCARIWFLHSRRFDIVHCLDCRPAVIFPGLFAKYFFSSKLVIEWLDWFGRGGTATERRWIIRILMTPIETFFEERFRKYADGTIGLGEPLTQRARDLGISDNILTIYHGCDTQELKVFSKLKSRVELGLKRTAYYIGYTGRMRKDAIMLFVETIEKLRNRYSLDVYGLLIGNSAMSVDVYIDQEIKKYIIKTSWIDYRDMNKYMSASDVLILPFRKTVARNTIWPSKINDYLSVGRPILSTDLEVLRKIIKKYAVGVLADDTGESLALNCCRLLKNEKRMNQMGKNARKLAETALTWKTIVKDVETFYRTL